MGRFMRKLNRRLAYKLASWGRREASIRERDPLVGKSNESRVVVYPPLPYDGWYKNRTPCHAPYDREVLEFYLDRTSLLGKSTVVGFSGGESVLKCQGAVRAGYKLCPVVGKVMTERTSEVAVPVVGHPGEYLDPTQVSVDVGYALECRRAGKMSYVHRAPLNYSRYVKVAKEKGPEVNAVYKVDPTRPYIVFIVALRMMDIGEAVCVTQEVVETPPKEVLEPWFPKVDYDEDYVVLDRR